MLAALQSRRLPLVVVESWVLAPCVYLCSPVYFVADVSYIVLHAKGGLLVPVWKKKSKELFLFVCFVLFFGGVF